MNKNTEKKTGRKILNPLISIITVCLNSEEYLENTILSVINQTYPNIEYVIIDGGSIDGTLAIIKKYENKISCWISEPDKGVYDGMNKGILLAKGDILYFLNSGDCLYDKNIIKKVAEKFLDKNIEAVYGNVEVIDAFDRIKSVRGCKVTLNSLLYRRICHQGLFVRKELFEEIGLFSLEYRFSADHEFIVKAIKRHPENFLYVDKVIAKYRDGGMSCKMMQKTKAEDLKIIASNYNKFQFFFGAAVCIFVVFKYKIPPALR